jgi:hypothetical protein
MDLFAQQNNEENYKWIVCLFRENGAVDAIRRANEIPLRTFYPIRFNGHNQPIPLWRNYLFIEFQNILTIQTCRSTNKLLKILSTRDDEGRSFPVLLKKEYVDESRDLMLTGRFNERRFLRPFYGKGSIVRVIEGTFMGKRVRLDMNIEPSMPGTRKISIELGGYKGSIEIWKLAL